MIALLACGVALYITNVVMTAFVGALLFARKPRIARVHTWSGAAYALVVLVAAIAWPLAWVSVFAVVTFRGERERRAMADRR